MRDQARRDESQARIDKMRLASHHPTMRASRPAIRPLLDTSQLRMLAQRQLKH